jgi:hypothetical protein
MNSCRCQTDLAGDFPLAAGHPCLQLIANKQLISAALAAPAKIAAGMDRAFVVNANIFSTKISTSNFPLELAIT